MTSKMISNGQIYRVGLTGVTREPQRTLITKNELAIIGLSAEDVRLKFTYVVDVSMFDEYRLDFVVREPERACLIRHHAEWVAHDSPDAVLKRDRQTEGVFQKVSVAEKARKFVVHAVTTLFAADEQHAKKKMKKRTAENEELIEFLVEEVAVKDGYASAKDTSVFPLATVIGYKA